MKPTEFPLRGLSEGTLYNLWIEQGRILVSSHDENQWRLGDWIVYGEEHFNHDDDWDDIDSHLLISQPTGLGECHSTRPKRFIVQVAEEVGLAVHTLENRATATRAFPPEKRNPRLSWTHHREAAPYERAQEYLDAAAPEGEPRRSVEWLRRYIARCEGKAAKVVTNLTFDVPEEMRTALEILAKGEGHGLRSLAKEICLPVLKEFIAARELNLVAAKSKKKAAA